MAFVDRLQQLVSQNTVCGIDFVDVAESQMVLDVYFFTHDAAPQANQILPGLTIDDVEIYAPFGADTLPDITVDSIAWQTPGGRTVLTISTSTPGDFSLYRLRINDARVDIYFNDVSFSFKANCELDLDCAPSEPNCDSGNLVDFPVNYLARDFNSYRDSLFEFASLRYPQWEDRLEADVGVMSAELVSAIGDELAFYQDKILQEAYLQTAVQRRSIKRHAQLVDYWPHDGLGASGQLVVRASAGLSGVINAGTGVYALSDTDEPIYYEVGRGLEESVAGLAYAINSTINELLPHSWDEDDRCLPKGAQEVYIEGHLAADLAFDDPVSDPTGKWMVISERESKLSPCPARHLVRVTSIAETRDEIIGQDITRLAWDKPYALPAEVELESLVIYANVLPITAGQTFEHRFVTGQEISTLGIPEFESVQMTQSVERMGNNDNTDYYQTLPDIDENQLVFLSADDDSYTARPEILIQETEFTGISWAYLPSTWGWRQSLLGVNSSQAADKHFCLEDGTWGRVVGYWRDGVEHVHQDYLANLGKTICFGNGEFGRVPPEGTIFSARYRLGNGTQGNVAPDAITRLTVDEPLIEFLFNPFTLSNGIDAESDQDVKRFAPQAFRAVTYRAVRKEDYAEAAERLDWVQRAGAGERWTGSWLSMFVTPDPLSSESSSSSLVSPEQSVELCAQMERFRQAGREVLTAQPKFADIDLVIKVCVKATSYIGDVKAHLQKLLLGQDENGQSNGYFADRNFTFGTPVRRAQLEAVVHSCPGVRAVLSIELRRRGWFEWRAFTELAYTVGMDEVVRVENDPLHPSRGSLKLVMEGGA